MFTFDTIEINGEPVVARMVSIQTTPQMRPQWTAVEQAAWAHPGSAGISMPPFMRRIVRQIVGHHLPRRLRK